MHALASPIGSMGCERTHVGVEHDRLAPRRHRPM
jgi:hypothetical protein